MFTERQELIRKKSAQLYARQNSQKIKGVVDLQLIDGDNIEQFVPNHAQIMQIIHDKINLIIREDCPFDTEIHHLDFEGIVTYLDSVIDKNQTYFFYFDFYNNILAVKIENTAKFLRSYRQTLTTLDFTLFNQYQIIDGHIDEMTIQLTNYLIV